MAWMCLTSRLLHDLLANGSDSPLYNTEVNESELHASLYYARAASVQELEPEKNTKALS